MNNSNTGRGAAISATESGARFNHCTIADINGMPRNALNGPDMGAFELQPSELTIYERKGTAGSGDWASWASAIPTLCWVCRKDILRAMQAYKCCFLQLRYHFI